MQLSAAKIKTRPPIAIEERHYARLSGLASNAHEPTGVCEYLREELERARVVSPTNRSPASAWAARSNSETNASERCRRSS
jgi:hypothetical protein